MPFVASARPEPAARLVVVGRTVHLGGAWTVHHLAPVERELAAFHWPPGDTLTIDVAGLDALDTAGAWLIASRIETLIPEPRVPEWVGLRADHQALLCMVRARAGTSVRRVTAVAPSWVARVGRRAWQAATELAGIVTFVGQSACAAARVRPRRLRWRAVLHNIESAGFRALPITGLLSFLMGIVIAYQGATQLERYGANIFVADLVGLAMLRELSPLLTAIIVAGRSGSAYAAQIGTMKVTEEVDALRTVGIPPFDLLVLPKLIALAIALPLLVVYADALAVVGGMIMAKTSLSVGFGDFLDRFEHAIDLSDYLVGIGKAPVFAAIIAVVGCYQGFQVSGDAESVGQKTTVSVVQSIFLVIVADAAFSVAFSFLGI